MSSHVSVTDAMPGSAAQRPEPIRAIPVRKTGQWISAVLLVAVLGWLVVAVGRNKTIQWHTIGNYLFDKTILRGMVVTLELTVLAMVLGVVLGIVLAVMRLSANPVLRSVSAGYLWLFRGTPVLVQIVLWFNLGLIFPTIGIGSFSAETNKLITAFGAALLALSLNEGAYMAEIVRGGIQSVDPGQTEAAHALGMTGGQTMRRIILPQAMRVIIPPTGNEVVTMLKTTSLVAVIGAQDLFTRAQAIGARNFTTFEMLLVASFWYLVLTSVLTVLQSSVERRFARGTNRARKQSTTARILANLWPGRVQSETGGAR